MKIKMPLLIGFIVCSQIFVAASARAQGSLTPPGAPAPTMKSLSQIEPRTPISSVPFTISTPGSYYATTNLTVPVAGTGITISANNVVLDLNGFSLSGVSNLNNGIVVAGPQTNIVIRNGAINNWANDAYVNGYNVSMERLTISGVDGYGLHLTGSIAVRDCLFGGNPDFEFEALFITGGLVTGCVFFGNSGSAIEADSSQVRNCLIQSNAGNGIILHANCLVTGNTITGNTGADAIQVLGNNNRIEDNHITGTGAGVGILVASTGTNNVIVKNSAAGFSVNYNVASGNDLGPVGAAATATSPWANISH